MEGGRDVEGLRGGGREGGGRRTVHASPCSERHGRTNQMANATRQEHTARRLFSHVAACLFLIFLPIRVIRRVWWSR